MKKKLQNPTFKGMPSEVKVLANTYKIELVPNLTHADTNSVYGMCDLTNKIISLNSSNKSTNMTEVLLHEILHAVWYEKGFRDFTKLTEEQTVNGLGIGLTLVFESNKVLRDYFNKQWSKR